MIGGNPEAGPETVAEPEPATQDVYPIMLPADQPLDALVDAILEFKVGNVPHWYQEMEAALAALCKAHGVDYPPPGMQVPAFASAPSDLATSLSSTPVKARGKPRARKNGRPAAPAEEWTPAVVKEETVEAKEDDGKEQRKKGGKGAKSPVVMPPSAATLERLSRPPPQIVVPAGAARKRLKRADSTPVLPKRPVVPVRTPRPMPKVLVRASVRPAVKRRTEVDRQLELLLPGGRFAEPSQNVLVRVLRLFNLCEIGGRRDGEAHVTARQRARMTDLSLLLDVVLKAPIACVGSFVWSSCRTPYHNSVKRDFVRLGLQRQLLSVIGRNTSDAYAVILRKVLRCCEALPLRPEDVHGTRSAHGSLGDTLRELTQHTDAEVRKRAYGLLKAHPVAAVPRPSSAGGEGGRLGAAGDVVQPLFARGGLSEPSEPPPSPPLDAVIMVRAYWRMLLLLACCYLDPVGFCASCVSQSRHTAPPGDGRGARPHPPGLSSPAQQPLPATQPPPRLWLGPLQNQPPSDGVGRPHALPAAGGGAVQHAGAV